MKVNYVLVAGGAAALFLTYKWAFGRGRSEGYYLGWTAKRAEQQAYAEGRYKPDEKVTKGAP